jgi:hypothetical protein
MAQRHRIVQKGVLDMASICISGSVAKPFGPTVKAVTPAAPRAVARALAGIDFGALASKAIANLFISFLATIVLVVSLVLS